MDLEKGAKKTPRSVFEKRRKQFDARQTIRTKRRKALVSRYAKKSADAEPAKGPSFIDLYKAHKGKKVCPVGHTSSGKPIHHDGSGTGDFEMEDHEEAAGVHSELANRIEGAIQGAGSAYNGDFGAPKGRAHHAAAKYLREIGEKHRKVSNAHYSAASKKRQEKWDAEKTKNKEAAAHEAILRSLAEARMNSGMVHSGLATLRKSLFNH